MTNDIVKPALVLLVVAMVSGLCLSVVYAVTREPAAQRMAETVAIAITRVFPEGGDIVASEGFEGDAEIFQLQYIQRDGTTVGYAIGSRFMGFGGVISLLVGINTDGEITGMDVLQHSETPGFGGNLTQPWFTEQFIGKYGHLIYLPAGTEPEDTGSDEVVSLTSATSTTRAVLQAVNNALTYFEQNLATN